MAENQVGISNERKINLVDLLIEILLHWRVLIVLMLVGALLFGGVSYIQSVRTANTQKAEMTGKEQEEQSGLSEIDQGWLEEQLTEVQIINVNTAIMYEELYEEKLEYQKSSLVMQGDPLNIPCAELTFIIKSDDMERTYNIEKVYEDIAIGSGVYEYLKEKCNLQNNVSEMLSLERTSYGQQMGSDTVRLKVLHYDADTCKKMAQTVEEYIESKKLELQDIVGAHEVEWIDRSFAMVSSSDWMAQQRTYETDLLTLQTNALNKKTDFTEEEWNYYNYLTSDKISGNPDGEDVTGQTGSAQTGIDAEDSTIAANETVEPGVSIIYVVLGMILFGCAYIFMLFMLYIINNKIRVTDSFQELYGISSFGVIPAKQEQKRLIGCVDKWLISLRNRNRRYFATEEAIKLAAVAVKMAVRKSDAENVYLIGCDLKEQSLMVCNQIKELLVKDNIQVEVLNNVIYDAEAMVALEKAKGVVLVEKAGSTLYDEVMQELEVVYRQEIPVFGGIITE
ncbi:MAG: hypothetical protein II994_00310 [Lachnospiraceae bacterium]|nr:hypothetical protein [Lachnospiraceae bacterium]